MQTLARSLAWLCVFSAVVYSVGVFPRLTTLIAAGLSLLLLRFFPSLRQRRFMFSALTMLLVLVDVSLRSRPGLPRFVKVVYGLPNVRTLEAASRGEVICGGCCVSGGEPRWLLVW